MMKLTNPYPFIPGLLFTPNRRQRRSHLHRSSNQRRSTRGSWVQAICRDGYDLMGYPKSLRFKFIRHSHR